MRSNVVETEDHWNGMREHQGWNEKAPWLGWCVEGGVAQPRRMSRSRRFASLLLQENCRINKPA
jgi:hypothetical protein